MKKICLAVTLSVLMNVSAIAEPPLYIIEDLGSFPGREDSNYYAYDINNNGDIVGKLYGLDIPLVLLLFILPSRVWSF